VWVERLGLESFRNYRRVEVTLPSGIALIVGRNAQGKTNLLEAVHFLGGFGSPRAPDAALVRAGSDRAPLHAEVVRGASRAGPQVGNGMGTREGDRRATLDMEIRPGKGTRALLNKTPISGQRALAAMCTSVFFGPDELSLIKGSPEGRRRFLDEVVVKLRPARAGLRREWERVLKQRNALLKSAPRDRLGGTARGKGDRLGGTAEGLETLAVWNESLGRVGATVAAARLEALAKLVPYASKRYEEIAGQGQLELAYVSNWLDRDYVDAVLREEAAIDEDEVGAMLSRAVDEVQAKELERGVSLVGPQRDDVSVLLQAVGASEPAMLDARTYASQGDQRTAALALKLAEHDLLTATIGETPILLLDDVFSELDPNRRGWLAGAVRAMGQALLTSAEPGVMESTHADVVVEVGAGEVNEVRLGDRQ
jgi:DNA replication and repair protein RecF